MLWVFVGYFGQVLRQRQQLKEVQALVGLFSLFASEKAAGCQLLGIIHSPRLAENLIIFHFTEKDW